MAQWILTVIAIAAVFYNTVVTHIILKNDVKHLKENVDRIMVWIFDQAKK
ncbi:unnamed protein product [marine sediment metagenome]|uniref:Uncharacterized protein n=1 Tax=marine sediment metagenome TaxID=412755 RepID=X1FVB7_9ZZZZ